LAGVFVEQGQQATIEVKNSALDISLLRSSTIAIVASLPSNHRTNPISNPIINPIINSIINPIINPIINQSSIINPIINSIINPIQNSNRTTLLLFQLP